MIEMMSGVMGSPRAAAWLVHFFVRVVVYGLAFAWVVAPIPWTGYWLRGAVLGAAGSLIAMVVMMPR